jgi:hypothetical protein
VNSSRQHSSQLQHHSEAFTDGTFAQHREAFHSPEESPDSCCDLYTSVEFASACKRQELLWPSRLQIYRAPGTLL